MLKAGLARKRVKDGVFRRVPQMLIFIMYTVTQAAGIIQSPVRQSSFHKDGSQAIQIDPYKSGPVETGIIVDGSRVVNMVDVVGDQ